MERPLGYHEDLSERHHITEEEITFLSELQKELNTQDDLGQADPKYWAIMDYKDVYGSSAGDPCIILYDPYKVLKSIEETAVYVERIAKDVYDETAVCTVSKGFFCCDGTITISTKDICSGEMEEHETLYSMEEAAEWLANNGEQAEYTTVETMSYIAEHTMFLTRKAALDHLQKNAHHYSDDAHTYAMTSWRNPEMEKLIKILRTVDFDQLKRI